MLKTVLMHRGARKNIHLGGWRKQVADLRDEEFRLKLHPSFLMAAVPPSGDLRPFCSPIEDQGELGSCTANAFAGLIEANALRAKAGKETTLAVRASTPLVNVSGITQNSDGSITFSAKVTPGVTPGPAPGPTPSPSPTPGPTPSPGKLVDVSRLFEYYATRKIEGTTSEDSGASIRDTAKAGAQYGIVPESAWPYDTSKFAQNPPNSIWTGAATHKVTSYHSITDGDILTMKSVLATGYLIEFGFNVYSYFMGEQMATQGFLDVPKSGETFEGGHAVDLCGWDDNMANPFNKSSKGAFLVRNSWSTSWGLAGYFWMSYDYVKNTRLASDFWVVQSSPLS